MATRSLSSTMPPGLTKETSDGHQHHKPRNRQSSSGDDSLSMVLFRPLGPDVPLGEFKQRLEMIATDLHKLLQLETQDFWSMVSFDRSILRCIDSFLRFSPRHWFEFEKLPEDSEMHELLQTVNRLVFLILLRLATNKDTSRKIDSKQPREVFLPPSEFGQLIYDKRIWTIPMLFDTVALYGRNNGAILTRMIESLFACQQKFADDLAAAFSSTELALRRMASQLEDLSIIKTHDKRSLLLQLSDMVVFAFDAFSTIEWFVKLYQPAASVIEQCCPTLTSYCADFADSTLQSLIQQLSSMPRISCQDEAASCTALDVETLLRIAAATEVRTVNAFHTLVSASSLRAPDFVNPELYFGAMTTVVGHHRFVWLLDQLHPVANDVAFLEKQKTAGHEVDMSCKEYVLAAVSDAKSAFQKPTPKKATPPVKQQPVSRPKAIAAGGPSKAEIEDLVDAVCVVMGDGLDRKFVVTCLARFDYNAEALIQAMLDDNLPPDLHELQLQGNEDDKYEYTSENIDAALTSVHIGKRDTVLEADEVKEMKPFYNKFATVVRTKTDEPQATSSGWAKAGNVPEMEYEDEYDDTYDDNEGAVGPQGATGDELLRRRGFTVPRVLAGPEKREAAFSDSEDEDEEEEEAQQQQQQSNNTGARPYGGSGRGWPQQQQQQRNNGSGGGRGRGQPAANGEQETERPGPRTGDTRGFKGASRDRQKMETAGAKGGGYQQQQHQRPRSDYGGPENRGGARPLNDYPQQRNRQQEEQPETGEQGQAHQSALPEDVQRRKKEQHKGSVGNHNRRDLAARKRREF